MMLAYYDTAQEGETKGEPVDFADLGRKTLGFGQSRVAGICMEDNPRGGGGSALVICRAVFESLP